MQEIEEFIARHANGCFRHREALMQALRTGDYQLEYGSVDQMPSSPASHHLLTYQTRGEHLRQFTSPHAHQLREDTEALCRELERDPDEEVRMWTCSRGAWAFVVFEGMRSGRVLGCFHVADRREMSRQEWDALWGEPSREADGS